MAEQYDITIIGTGLIGGSFALALKAAGFGGKIVGCDRRNRNFNVRQDCAGGIGHRAGDAACIGLTEQAFRAQKENTKTEHPEPEPNVVSSTYR